MSDLFSSLGNPYYRTPVPVVGAGVHIAKRFSFSCHSIGWDNPLHNEPLGMDDGMVLFPRYGSAIVGGGRTVHLWPPQPGDSFVMFREPVTMLSGVLRLPFVVDPKKAGAQIFRHSQRRFSAASKKKPDVVDVEKIALEESEGDRELNFEDEAHETEAARKKRNMHEIDPWEYEVAHVVSSLERLFIRPYACESCVIFIGGDLTDGSWGVPPAQVNAVLSALAAGGFMTRTMRMFMRRGGRHHSAEFIFDPVAGRVKCGDRPIASVSPGKPKFMTDLLATMEIASKHLAGYGEGIEHAFTHFLIPMAVGLWSATPQRVNERLKGVLSQLADAPATQREGKLAEHYREWHRKLPTLRNRAPSVTT